MQDKYAEVKCDSLLARGSQDAWNRATIAEKRQHETLIMLSKAIHQHSERLENLSKLLQEQTRILDMQTSGVE